MDRPLSLLVFLLVGVFAAPNGRAQDRTDLQVSVGPIFTLTGIGLSSNVRITPQFSASAEFSVLPFPSVEVEIEDLEYDLDPGAYSILLLGHYHPGAGNFAIGAGVMFGGYGLEGVATPSEPVEVGGTTYQPEELGEVTGDFALGGPSVLLEVARRGTGFNVSLGVLIPASSRAEWTVTGMAADDPDFQEDVDLELEEIEDELQRLPVLPYFRIGYQFGL
ncbi:MAG: hypothetical protein AAGF99_14920 [Bacteroidota bacterium]